LPKCDQNEFFYFQIITDMIWYSLFLSAPLCQSCF